MAASAADGRPWVLVIDADERVQTLMQRGLPHFGFAAVGAGSMAEAVRLLDQAGAPDLILLDWLLPDVRAIDALDALRARDDAPPIVILSTTKDREAVLMAIHHGAAYYAVKPIRLGHLVLKMNAVLGHRERSGPVRREARPLQIAAEIPVVLLNISASGCAFDAPFALPSDTVLFLNLEAVFHKLQLPHGRGVPVRTANCRARGRRYNTGAQFIDMPADAAERLRRYCTGADSIAAGASAGGAGQRSAAPSGRLSDEMDHAPVVLSVDDDAHVRQFLAALLEREGAEVLQASSCEDGRGILAARHDIDLLILDILMPGMNGLELLEELQGMEDAPRALVLSATGMEEDVEAAIRRGAVDYLTKPVNRDRLLFKVRNLLRTQAGSARNRTAPRKQINIDAAIPLVLSRISSKEVVLDATFPLEPDTAFSFRSEELTKATDADWNQRFSVRVAACEGRGNRYRFTGTMLGLSANLAAALDRIQEPSAAE
ncbi:MAG: response regulator [Planctomycetota bacterium]